MSALPIEALLMQFLRRFEQDRMAGRIGSLEHYQALYPGCARQLAEEYAALTDTEVQGVSGRLVAGYELLREVGSGGQSVVYSAITPARDGLVALKVMKDTIEERRVRRFAREAEIVRGLEHEGIARVQDHGRDGETHYLAMEWIQGQSLAESAEPGVVPDAAGVRRACQVVCSILRALHAAHVDGVVHRDLKPANVMIDERGRALLIDFGFAALKDDVDNSISRSADVVGTAYYMAPEQFEGRTVHHAVDIWAAGVVLFELLTGRRPFDAPSIVQIEKEVRLSEPPDIRSLNPVVGPELAACVDMALQKRPGARYVTAAHFADDLQRALDGRPVLARPAGPVTRWWRAARRRPWAAGFALVVLLSTVGITTLSLAAADGWRAEAASSAKLADVAVTLAHVVNDAARYDADAEAGERGVARGYANDDQLRESLNAANARLRDLAEAAPDDERLVYADSLVADALGLVQYTLEDYRLARPLFARAADRNLRLRQLQPGDPLYRGNHIRAQLRGAMTEQKLGETGRAYDLLEQADGEARLAREELGLAWATKEGLIFNGIANLYRDLRRYEQAYARFRDADELLVPLRDADRSEARDWVLRDYLCYECALLCRPAKEAEAAQHREGARQSLVRWDRLSEELDPAPPPDPDIEHIRKAMGF